MRAAIFLRQWTDPGMADLYSVAIDPVRDAPVAVDYLKRDSTVLGSDVWLLDRDGHLGAHWGRTDGSADAPSRYHDVCRDGNGNVFVGDILGDRVQKWVRVVGKKAAKASH